MTTLEQIEKNLKEQERIHAPARKARLEAEARAQQEREDAERQAALERQRRLRKTIGISVPGAIHQRLKALQGDGPVKARRPLKEIALEALEAGLPLIEK